VTTKHKNPA